ncbi:tripartite tricarboxylate transporter substrate-binding protein [Bradyrhizobium retamae]|uniref:Uncharacterized protein n=1 Tax=Bradyrhizobium retamae TaxID=1300035 RepID=A0A0R3MRJ7_9BRAD|nr:tripartite tricarboxylate transporter substrate-binding protein [Bradyrhizobium retamae]KRR22465.1 hypothetical protein CQ13_28960 [Bradyrhizobium retamae]
MLDADTDRADLELRLTDLAAGGVDFVACSMPEVAAPKGLPKEIATQYETAIKKVWDSAEFKEFMNRRGFDMIYLDSAGFAEFMKADNEDNGKALKSLGLAK